jgi:hypothetical protein
MPASPTIGAKPSMQSNAMMIGMKVNNALPLVAAGGVGMMGSMLINIALSEPNIN